MCNSLGGESPGHNSLASKQANRQVAGVKRFACDRVACPSKQTVRQEAGYSVAYGRVAWAANRQERRQVAGCALALAE